MIDIKSSIFFLYELAVTSAQTGRCAPATRHTGQSHADVISDRPWKGCRNFRMQRCWTTVIILNLKLFSYNCSSHYIPGSRFGSQQQIDCGRGKHWPQRYFFMFAVVVAIICRCCYYLCYCLLCSLLSNRLLYCWYFFNVFDSGRPLQSGWSEVKLPGFLSFYLFIYYLFFHP